MDDVELAASAIGGRVSVREALGHLAHHVERDLGRDPDLVLGADGEQTQEIASADVPSKGR